VRRGEKLAEKREAANELVKLQQDYPRAFTAEDAKLCDALEDASDDTRLNETLEGLAREIRADIRQREQEERDKADETREKIDHAGK
jgi:benzoyl-CoA reductase/2-hydroxyglutaryl-CoA dehydratase subunit BcrC/BadD/HgdB